MPNYNDIYSTAVRDSEVLTPEEEYKMLKRMRELEEGSPEYEELMEELVTHNLRLVHKVTSTIIRNPAEYEDAVQEGTLGLVTAIKKYDVNMVNEKGEHMKLSTYAVWWIRQAVTRYKQNVDRSIRVPIHIYDQWLRMRKCEKHLMQKLGRDPTSDEIAEELPDDYAVGVPIAVQEEVQKYREKEAEGKKLTSAQKKRYKRDLDTLQDYKARRVREIYEKMTPILSIDANFSHSTDGGSFTIADAYADTADTPEEKSMKESQLEALLEIMKQSLTDRELDIVQARLGIDGPEHTLQDIGDRYHLSRERIRQIEKVALRKLKIAILQRPDCKDLFDIDPADYRRDAGCFENWRRY